MPWLPKAIWGCFVTIYLLWFAKNGSLPVDLNFYERWAVVVVVGWGPMLMPLTWSKFFMALWGYAATVSMGPVVVWFHRATDTPFSTWSYWMAIIVIAWGPLLLPWARRAMAGGAASTSSIVDSAPRAANSDWHFKCPELELSLDLAKGELRVIARNAKYKSGGFDAQWATGRVDITRPARQCRLEVTPIMKNEYVSGDTFTTIYNNDGSQTSIRIPGVGRSYETETGRHMVRFKQSSEEIEVVGEAPLRNFAGAIVHRTRTVEKSSLSGNLFDLDIEIASKGEGTRLTAEWKVAAKMISELTNAMRNSILAERQARDEVDFIAKESADKVATDQSIAKARAHVAELSDKAGVEEPFSAWQRNRDGSIIWLIGVDKNARGFIEVAGDVWMGSITAAGATARIVELPMKGDDKKQLEYALEIELRDPEFERKNLAKRRYKLMQGCTVEELRVWTDRFEILTRPSPAAQS